MFLMIEGQYLHVGAPMDIFIRDLLYGEILVPPLLQVLCVDHNNWYILKIRYFAVLKTILDLLCTFI